MLNYQMPFEHQNIYYESIGEVDRLETEMILANYFGPFEPMNQSVGVTTNDFQLFAKLITDYAIEKKLSIVAKDKETGKIVSVTILKDFMDDLPIDIEQICPKLLPVFAVMGDLAIPYMEQESNPKPGDILELLIGITVPSYWNRGITTILWAASEVIAKQNNFKKIVSFVTSISSQHITLNKLNYKEIGSVSYQTYKYEGSEVFKSIAGVSSCKFVEKKI